MRIIRYNQLITRNEKGKKLYNARSVPFLPKNWQKAKSTLNINDVLDGKINHIIVPKKDLVVIDCDSKEAIKEVKQYISKKDYIVASDIKSSCHFYFIPTKYYFKKLGKNRTKTTNKIDLLIGKSLIFTPNKFNKTKIIKQGSLDNIQPISKELVDYLYSKLKKGTKDIIELKDGEVKQIPIYYIGEQLKKALTMYKATKKFKHLYPIFELITPTQYKEQVEPSMHPNNINDGEGINYLQAITAKIGNDPTIDLKLHKKLIETIALELWDEPLDKSRLDVFLNTIKTQKYSDGSPIFTYDKKIKKNLILVRQHDSPQFPLYRTYDDTYCIVKSGRVVELPNFTALKRFIASDRVVASINGKDFKTIKDAHIAYMPTVLIRETIALPQGLTFDNKDFIYYFNQIAHVPPFELLRYSNFKGDFDYTINKEGKAIIELPDSIPTIKKVLNNIVYDHPNKKEHLSKLLLFLARKLTTLDYSPIVLQLLGGEGTGKSIFTQLLDMLTGGVAEVVLDSRFNAEFEKALFFYEDEGKMTKEVLNRVKQISGNKDLRIEAKNKNAFYTQNIGTVIINSNKYTTLADTMSNRRFVHLLSFNAPMLIENDLIDNLKSEVLTFAKLLKSIASCEELKYITDSLYFSALSWHDEASRALITSKLEQQIMGIQLGEEKEQREQTLGMIVQSWENTDPATLYHQLEHVFGRDFKSVITSYKGELKFKVPIKATTPYIIADIEIDNNYLKNSKVAEYGLTINLDYSYKGKKIKNITLPLEWVKKISEYIHPDNILVGRKKLKEIKSLAKLEKA